MMSCLMAYIPSQNIINHIYSKTSDIALNSLPYRISPLAAAASAQYAAQGMTVLHVMRCVRACCVFVCEKDGEEEKWRKRGERGLISSGKLGPL